MTACLLGFWLLLSLGVAFIFGVAMGLSVWSGGVIHSLASLAQGFYYFSYRGAAAASKMVTALGWGIAIKFAIVILVSSAVLYFLDQMEPLGLLFGVVLMHLLHGFGNAFFLR